MATILPTKTCFDDALDYLAAALADAPEWALEHLVLVHGILLSPPNALEPNEPFAHGWVEQDRRVVIQAGIVEGQGKGYYGVDRREFYAQMRVQCTTVYTIEEAWEQNRRSNHFGPWESSYRALCGGGKTYWEAS